MCIRDRDISFTLYPGQTAAVIGSTGSGKSTLADLLLRLHDVGEGAIRVDGADVRALTQEELRERIGCVPQDVYKRQERLLRSLGTTGKLAGFRCTVYMIERIQEDPEQLQLITKRLYKETGKKFGVSAASVERNLRTLIHFCWSRTDHSF